MTRTCDRCGKHLITHRADARFCDKDCSNAWHNAHRLSNTATDKHLTSVSGTEGSRGGNVRSVSEARELQEQQKDKARWTLIVREHMARTLLETGYIHADDLYELGVPETHSAIKGSQTASFVCRGWMERSGAERKVSHKAANGRKAPIYRISAKGRQELSKLARLGTDNSPGANEGASRDGDAVTSVGAEPGESGLTGPGSGAGEVPSEDEASGSHSPSPTGTASPEPLSLLPEPDPEAWAA